MLFNTIPSYQVIVKFQGVIMNSENPKLKNLKMCNLIEVALNELRRKNFLL